MGSGCSFREFSKPDNHGAVPRVGGVGNIDDLVGFERGGKLSRCGERLFPGGGAGGTEDLKLNAALVVGIDGTSLVD